jgi:hypothetical protein
VDTDDNIGPHLADEIGREVVKQAAVGVNLSLIVDRRETGIDIVDRRAFAREPSEKTFSFPVTRSAATQRKGIGRSSKFFVPE